MPMEKNWKIKETDKKIVNDLAESLGVSISVAHLLILRGITTFDLAKQFFRPDFSQIHNPFLMKDMQKAVDRIQQAIANNEKVLIYGDYDVDGATSTALLTRYFALLKVRTKIYIPNRKTEGYGPNIEGFNKLIELGAKVIFTVDCGTSSFEPIKVAQSKNTDVIVLDHHQSDIKLPNAYAIVNPNRYDDTSELNYLCAVGVCFMFLAALNKKLRDSNWFKEFGVDEPNILNFLDLVSLGTVCDVVPLVGLNRAIVKQGLSVLKKRLNMGLKTLYDFCNIGHQPNTHDLGYKIGPRINAGGRVGKSSHGAELLFCDDPQKSYQLALDLDKYNKERQSIELLLTEKVTYEAHKHKEDPVLVLAGNDWHEGIIGIVASRMKDKFNKPTVLISLTQDIGKGSARSVNGFDIGAQIIKAVQSNLLLKGGGHKMAGGFTLKKDNISKFRSYLINNIQKTNLNFSNTINLNLDTIIAPSALNEEFYYEINKLAPFGSGNNEPKFVIENLRIITSNLVADKHIKSILYGKDGSVIKGVAFNAKNSPLEPFLNKNNKKKLNIAGKIHLNEWRGKENVEFIIEDISLS